MKKKKPKKLSFTFDIDITSRAQHNIKKNHKNIRKEK